MLRAYAVTDSAGKSLFAFKLHQFIAGGGKVYTTLEAPGKRAITLDGQQFVSGDDQRLRRYYHAHFCRDCGQEYIPVWDIDGPEGRAPKMLLRRLKTDKLEGLPRKHEHVISTPMPSRQADAYGRALAMKELSGPEGTLGMIHALRRISLHPLLLEGGVGSEELRVEDSARMMATLEVLDRVAEVGEKALVFLESLDLQDADQLPLLLKRRYGLARLPMVINGQVATEARQARVNDFQRERGFDVMLLSPKAGGVGLTLTAAEPVRNFVCGA